MNNNRDTFTDRKCLHSSDVKDRLVKENKTFESVLVDESFADLTCCSKNKTSVDDADNINSSNALTNSRTLHFSINKNDKLQK